jgi:hypothetical protein
MIESTTGLTIVHSSDRFLAPARITYSPTAWRLARRNGELILQAGSLWTEGRESGIEWKDVPTVDLETTENTNG